jgi:hypothetical protein
MKGAWFMGRKLVLTTLVTVIALGLFGALT